MSKISTGISSPQAENEILIYPVPSSDLINLRIPNELLPCKVYLSDLTGRIKLSTILTHQNESINISALSDGIYFVKAGISRVVKIIKN